MVHSQLLDIHADLWTVAPYSAKLGSATGTEWQPRVAHAHVVCIHMHCQSRIRPFPRSLTNPPACLLVDTTPIHPPCDCFPLSPQALAPDALFLPSPPPLPHPHVPDTLFTADLTIMEEGTELLHRLEAKAAERAGQPPSPDNHASPILPMFTSCCPGWVAMVEKSNPELIPYLST